MKGKEFVYIVGDRGPEHNSIQSIHKTYSSAKKAWNSLREELLEHAKKCLEFSKNNAKKILNEELTKNKKKQSKETINYYQKELRGGNEMYLRMIKSLSEKNPGKVDNYPHETPYIKKVEVEP